MLTIKQTWNNPHLLGNLLTSSISISIGVTGRAQRDSLAAPFKDIRDSIVMIVLGAFGLITSIFLVLTMPIRAVLGFTAKVIDKKIFIPSDNRLEKKEIAKIFQKLKPGLGAETNIYQLHRSKKFKKYQIVCSIPFPANDANGTPIDYSQDKWDLCRKPSGTILPQKLEIAGFINAQTAAGIYAKCIYWTKEKPGHWPDAGKSWENCIAGIHIIIPDVQ